ncbi:MAG: hypothetical protein H6733_01320 [Alphaproteobacteria bacterium]|nr:hypothetical protein [Alphaproteobacteria bacterium]
MPEDLHLPMVPTLCVLGVLGATTAWRGHRETDSSRPDRATLALIGWTLAVALVARLLPRELVPADAFTMLFEGRTTRVVEAIAADRGLPHAWLGLASGYPVLPVVDHLVTEIACLAVALPWLALLLARFSGRAWLGPVVVAGVCLADTSLLQVALDSESQGFLALTATASAWMAWWATTARSGVTRALAVFVMLGLAGVALPLRPEMVLVGTSAAVAALAALLGPDRVARLDTAWRNLLPLRAFPPLQAVALVALTMAATYAVTVPGWLVLGEQSPSPPGAAGPPDSTLRWFADLAMLHPPVIPALATLGLAWCARRPLATAGLGVTFVLLTRVYAWNSHFGEAWFESLRYLANLQVPLVLLVAAGLGELAVWWAAVPVRSPTADRAAVAVVTVAGVVWCVAAPPAAPSPGPLEDDHPWLVSRNHELEGRFLLGQLRAHPDCVFRSVSAVDTVAAAQGEDMPTADRYTFEGLWFGWHAPPSAPHDDVTWPRRFLVDVGPLDTPPAWWSEAVATTRCQLFYEGLDCHLVDGPRCDRFLDGLVPVAGEDLDALELNLHHGERTRHAHLGLYAAPGHAP